MRVISGTYKGRILRSVRDPRVRPATDRVKESIFNILQNRFDIRGARVLDLFAGSGSLGFEALSRGAAEVVFVDEWQGATMAIEENIKLLLCQDRCQVIKADVYKFLRHADRQYDLVFVDPPYRLENAVDLPRRIFDRSLAAPSGFVIMEHAARVGVEPSDGFELLLERTFGNTKVSFFMAAQSTAAPRSTTP
ncbi:MAG: 16S rRNA (guanine(966)-N(2))-methyltransferase RsmD [Bacteroidota bacterium]